ncbi:ABC transporter permease subunit [Treponema sp.]|uniref:ABC transporter permease n=1 Tax=Treponema sp. TaxID=166 RepID=UPI00298EB72B|nr:ABC transporter permease [Treponema sp.]MCR5613845.1 ABC transporter permease [Treponema sp.]
MFCSIIIEGLIYGIMVLGVFMSYRVLNFCDMTVDGAFPLGGCILAACLTIGMNPVIALCFAFMGGILAGLCTTVIYTKLKIPDLLAGILVMTMLYSINLRVMSNKANISFLKIDTPFSKITAFCEAHFPNLPAELGICIFLIIFVIALKWIMDIFYHTDLGLTMGALGANQQMIISQGVNPQIVRGIGVCVGDGLAALSGAFAAMYNGFADVGSGTGVIVSGLASLMLGEFIIRSNKIGMQTLRVLIGSIIYRGIMYFGRSYGFVIGLTSNDLKLITGLLIIICLIISKKGNKHARA